MKSRRQNNQQSRLSELLSNFFSFTFFPSCLDREIVRKMDSENETNERTGLISEEGNFLKFFEILKNYLKIRKSAMLLVKSKKYRLSSVRMHSNLFPLIRLLLLHGQSLGPTQ